MQHKISDLVYFICCNTVRSKLQVAFYWNLKLDLLMKTSRSKILKESDIYTWLEAEFNERIS